MQSGEALLPPAHFCIVTAVVLLVVIIIVTFATAIQLLALHFAMLQSSLLYTLLAPKLLAETTTDSTRYGLKFTNTEI